MDNDNSTKLLDQFIEDMEKTPTTVTQQLALIRNILDKSNNILLRAEENKGSYNESKNSETIHVKLDPENTLNLHNIIQKHDNFHKPKTFDQKSKTEQNLNSSRFVKYCANIRKRTSAMVCAMRQLEITNSSMETICNEINREDEKLLSP